MDANTTVATVGKMQYATELKTATHTVLVDEPVDNGGKNLGPSPGDLLRMSLASCTAITLRMYANRKKFDIENIGVTVSTEQVNGKTVFNRKVEIKGKLDDEQRKRMLQIANACPVHKILTISNVIETILLV